MIRVSIINASTTVSDAEAAATVAALQIQATRDFAPLWRIDATLSFVPKGRTAPTNTWQLAILDHADTRGTLGRHEATNQGQPLGKIFAATEKQHGASWSVTASHELFEMLVDPWVNLTVFDRRTKPGRLYAYEICDACEDNDYAYKINNILVSDFVTPAWFEGWREPNSTRFDYGNHITAPFQLLKGGYIGYFDIKRGAGWKKLYGDDSQDSVPMCSRRDRRVFEP